MKLLTKPYLTMQRELDQVIMTNHQVTYKNTKKERFLALFVELSELANESRSFKYWSKKSPSPRAVLLDEYADGIHFFFSLALAYELTLPETVEASDTNEDLTTHFLSVITSVTKFYEAPCTATFVTSLSMYLSLGKALYFSESDIKDAYDKKMMVNYKRQENDY